MPSLLARLRPRVSFRIWATLVAVLAAAAAGFGVYEWRQRHVELERKLVSGDIEQVAADPALVRFAVAEAKPVFAKNCAACHGADLKGVTAIGAPNLTDKSWLNSDGSAAKVERTILYGIRSGHPKGQDITEMPAFGQRGRLSENEIDDVVQYVRWISGAKVSEEAVDRGRMVYAGGRGECFDCHSTDAKGNTAYGATDLTAGAWAYGGDPKSLHDSIYYGRRGVMPAWIGKLSLLQIRALAVYVHSVSH